MDKVALITMIVSAGILLLIGAGIVVLM